MILSFTNALSKMVDVDSVFVVTTIFLSLKKNDSSSSQNFGLSDVTLSQFLL